MHNTKPNTRYWRPNHLAYFEALIEWDILKTLWVDCEIRKLTSHNCWDRVFMIDNPAYRQLTLEVLSTLEADQAQRIIRTRHTRVIFILSLWIGSWDESYTVGGIHGSLWCGVRRECTVWVFRNRLPMTHDNEPILEHSVVSDCEGTRKTSHLKNPVHKYIHALISHTIWRRKDSTMVVTKSYLYVMYGIVQQYPVHLGTP